MDANQREAPGHVDLWITKANIYLCCTGTLHQRSVEAWSLRCVSAAQCLYRKNAASIRFEVYVTIPSARCRGPDSLEDW